jgi:hypothetical protein
MPNWKTAITRLWYGLPIVLIFLVLITGLAPTAMYSVMADATILYCSFAAPLFCLLNLIIIILGWIGKWYTYDIEEKRKNEEI